MHTHMHISRAIGRVGAGPACAPPPVYECAFVYVCVMYMYVSVFIYVY